MTHEHTSAPSRRRRDIHRPERARRAAVHHPARPITRWHRRARFGLPAALGLAALSAGLVSTASASSGTEPSRTVVSATATATPTLVPATPAAVASAQSALQQAMRLTQESRTIAAAHRRKIDARSAELRALIAGRADSAAASRSGEREPVSRRAAAKAVEAPKDAAVAIDPVEATPAALPSAVETFETPVALSAVEPVESISAALSSAEPVETSATVTPAVATRAVPTRQLERATRALTDLMRAAKAVAVRIQPAPDTPGEILTAQARAARAAAAVLAKHANALAGHRNGQIPTRELCGLSFAAGETLRCDAAQQLERLDRAYRAQFGTHLEINDSYRSYSDQVAVAATRGYLAAIPGYSNHGWAVAVDLGGGVQAFGSAQHEWMRAHGGAFGWANPDWAQADGRKPEAWHWEFRGV